MANNKADYEPIPDVENGANVPVDNDKSREYADMGLDSDQTKLLLSLDSAIASSSLDLKIPSVDPSEMASQGKSFVMGIITPTLAAACTFASALYLQKASQYNSFVADVMVPLFPYLNATILFVTTAWPIQQRLMDAIEPLFKKSDSLQNDFKERVEAIGPNMDETVDSIQDQVRTVLKPMEPTLQKAKSQTSVLTKLDPNLEIPDTSDMDREFDEMQDVMGDKIDQAASRLELSKYIPVYLQSHKNFYWYIVVPTLAVALLMQLALAFIFQQGSSTSVGTNVTNVTTVPTSLDMPMHRHYLRGLKTTDFNQDDEFNSTVNDYQNQFDSNMDEYKDHLDSATEDYKDQLNETTKEYKDQLNSTVSDYKDQLDSTTKEYKDQLNSTVNDYKDTVDSTVNDYKDTVDSTVNGYKDQLNSTINDYKDQLDATTTEYKDKVDSTVNEYKDKANNYKKQFDDTTNEYKDKANEYKNQFDDTTNEYKDQLNSTLNDYKNQLNATAYQDQLDSAIAKSKSLVLNVVWSYIMALLQLALVYLLTNERIKALVINRIISHMQDEAMRTLRQYGVIEALEDVLGNKMTKVRTQMMKILTLYKKIESLLGKIPNVGDVSNKISSLTGGSVSAKDVSDKVASMTGGSVSADDINDKVASMSGKFSKFTKGFK